MPGKSFAYSYDRLNRLISGITTDSAYAERNITYDQAGNIQTLSRVYGGNLTDSLVYNYTKNGVLTGQLQNIQDLSDDPGTTGYAAGTGSYHYDPNGNMNVFSSTNPAAKTYSAGYNLLNLPNLVHTTVNSVYEYDANGEKLSRVIDTNKTDYISGIQYDNGRISFIQTEEGRVFPYSTDTSNYYQYFLADHLGNTRVAFDTPHDTLKVEQQDDYLPFGMEISQSNAANPKNEYLYNKKELQEDSQLYDYGARFYDPVVGRFTTVDPLAEISRRFSPYDYGEDNSIRNIDSDGMETIDLKSTDGGNIYLEGEAAQNYFAQLQAQQQSSGDRGKGKNKGKEKKTTSKTPSQKWDSDIPVIGLADKAADELKNGQYANAALDEGSAILEMFTFAESEVVNTGISAWDSLAGLFIKDARNIVNQSSTAVLVNGYYEVNGFKFSEYYYNRLWNTGRGAPSLVAKEVLDGAKKGIPDAIKAGFNKYVYGGWEMIYNPATKEVWHLQPIK